MTLKTGDTSAGPRRRLVDRQGQPADLTAATVRMQVRGRPGVSFPVDIVDAAGGVVRVPRGDLDVPDGRALTQFSVEFEVTFSDGVVQTFPESGYDRVTVFRDLDGV